MKLLISGNNKLYYWAAFLLIASEMATFAVTTDDSRYFLLFFKYIVFLFFILIWGLGLKNKDCSLGFVAGFIFVALVFWGWAVSNFTGSAAVEYNRLIGDFLTILVGVLFFSRGDKGWFAEGSAKLFVIYVLAIFLMTIYWGGFEVSYPARFIFDADSERMVVYSQSVSKFYGYGAIAAFFYALKISNKKSMLLFLFLGLALLSLSFIGGARGDSLAAAVVVALFVFFKFPLASVLTSVFLFGSIYWFSGWSWLDGFVITERLLAIISGDLGMRDILLKQSLFLLADNIDCLLVGCGFNYFQYFYGYEFGYYPHNFIAEFVIVYGVILSAVIFLLAATGVFLYWNRNRDVDLFLLFFLYSFLVAMKSGSLFSNRLFVIALICMASFALSRMVFGAKATQSKGLL